MWRSLTFQDTDTIGLGRMVELEVEVVGVMEPARDTASKVQHTLAQSRMQTHLLFDLFSFFFYCVSASPSPLDVEPLRNSPDA